MDFNFHMPVHVVSGEGAVARNSTLLRTLGRRCLIITGGSSAKRSGALADVTAALDLWEIGWAVYDAVGPNPLVSACHEAGVVARSVRAEFIIGIGGGSPTRPRQPPFLLPMKSLLPWISFKGRVQIRRCLWHSLAQRRAQAVRFLPWLC